MFKEIDIHLFIIFKLRSLHIACGLGCSHTHVGLNTNDIVIHLREVIRTRCAYE